MPGKLQLTDLAVRNDQAIRIAGPRYTPGVDPDAPNLRIEHLLPTVHALSLGEDFKRHIQGLEKELTESLRSARHTIDPLFKRNQTTPGTLVRALAQLGMLLEPRAIGRQVKKVTRLARRLNSLLDHRRHKLYEQQRILCNGESTREERSRLDNRIRDVSNITEAISSALDYLDGVPGRLLTKSPCLFLRGAWGTGKTHFLCDIAKGSMAGGTPALLLIASSLAPGIDPLDAVAASTGLAASGDDLLDGLELLGAAANRRALLLIDAINEGDRAEWRRKLADIVNRVKLRPHVGLILSCRTPFEVSILTPAARSRIVETEHFGFQGLEVDAQLAYFDYYDISAPNIPLLTPEFSRPLFLKLLCEGMAQLTRSSKNRNVKDVASGQKGMTYVLEHFAKSIGSPIEADFGLPKLTCWKLMKGEPNRNHLGIAGTMAQHRRDFLTSDEALACAVDSLSLTEAAAMEILRRMVVDGLLAEDMRWHKKGYSNVFVFPYQRFGDHLIARHLLDEHLDAKSATANSIRHSLYVGRPLGEPFEFDKWRTSFKYPGIAAALMLEFPERMKRTSLSRELFYYLPKNRKMYIAPVKEVFLEGLYWRDRESFTPETSRLLFQLLNLNDRYVRHETFEVLVGLATRSEHPYNASFLLKYLAQATMPERDIKWSEYVRSCDDESVVYRLLAWIEQTANRHRSEIEMENEIRLLSLLLTTTARYTRDRATRALALLGIQSPQILFQETIASFDFNDPYVVERMLGASYGVVMRLWAAPEGDAVRAATHQFARSLVQAMFIPGAKYATSHTLRRGYALGIIELARRIDRNTVATQHVKYLDSSRYPSPSSFRPARRIRKADVEDVRSVLQMDFANYTLGRLTPDRANYQNNHPEYQAIRKQILWRVKDLGYTVDQFGEIDQNIGRAYWRERDGKKVDRYGKKYSWIAFFEMYGQRSDEGKLDEHRSIERTSDCDIDPSFPEEPLTWKPPLPDVFESAPMEMEAWMRSGIVPDYESLLCRDEVDGHHGPWVLLDGFVLRQTEEREVFTFLRGVMIRDGFPFRALSEYVDNTEYLGKYCIPEEGADYYTFAGEVPWSRMCGIQEGQSNRRQLGHAFYGFQHGRWNGIPVEVPIRRWAWETHHSLINQASGVNFPSPSICDLSNLRSHNAGFDLFDAEGKPASLYREWPADDADGFTRSHLVYLRQDLLTSYLEFTKQRFLWIPWGERNAHYRAYERGLSSGATDAISKHVNCFGNVIHFETT